MSHKEYQIVSPKKCSRCDKIQDCEFQKLLHQKPFDPNGVILDCRTFYIVFCELEERCHIPYGDAEKLKQYYEEKEAGKRPFLTPTMVTNGVLAAELAIKSLTLKETGAFDCIHDIDKLFYALQDIHLTALSSLLKERVHQNDTTLKVNLETISDFFTRWRYFFVYEDVGCSSFLTEFIHIVCDYAMDEVFNVK